MSDEKRLYPGDPGYKGGISHTTVYMDGKVKDVRIEKDGNGNILSTIITDKIFGLF